MNNNFIIIPEKLLKENISNSSMILLGLIYSR